MKRFFTFCFLMSLCVTAFADLTPVTVPQGAPVSTVAPTLPVNPAGPVKPVSPATTAPQVSVAEPAAPPQWAQDLIVTAEKLPIIGPVISKALIYLGILSSILTMSIAFLITVLNTLMGIFNLAGLVNAATKLASFRDGKIMYWLKFFSLFNASKKPATPQ